MLGVQPANTDWGTSLSPAVEAALVPLVDAAVAQLKLWNESRGARLETHTHSFPPGDPRINHS